MTTGGNPLGNYGHLTYAATDDANKGLVAINAIYQAADAQIGALGFTNTNRLPVAVNDGIIAVTKNVSISIPISTLLSNDSDPDGDTIRISAVSQGSKGSVSKTTTHIVYAPTTEQVGADTFEYTVSDPLGKTGIGTVTLNIVSAAPVAQTHSITDGESNKLILIPTSTLIAGATDSDGNDALITFHSVSARSTQLPAASADNISLSANADISQANVIYNPPTDVTGEDTFTFNIIDEDTVIGVGTVSVILYAGAGLVSVLTADERAKLDSALSLSTFLALK